MKRTGDASPDRKFLDETSTELGGGAESAAAPHEVKACPESSSVTYHENPPAPPGLAEIALDSSDASGRFPTGFTPGQVIAERYEILRFVGRGAMGEVYEARDSSLGGHVALKTIVAEDATDERAILRFKREIQLARRVTHPNVCRIFDIGLHQDNNSAEGSRQTAATMFLTMEFLAGETLTARLNRTGAMSVGEALGIVEQIAGGLEAAHQAGVIHRDLKPGNIILVPVESGVRAVITDFGLARTNAVLPEEPGSISAPGAIVGTPEYMAPEQIKGETATPATDIYALGIVMYAMVTGTLPFKGPSRRAIAFSRLEEHPASPREHAPGLDPCWEQVILQCLNRNPASRFTSATEIIDELHNGHRRAPGYGGKSNDYTDRFFPALRHRALLGTLAIVILTALAAFNPSIRQRLRQQLGVKHLPQVERVAVLPFTVVGGDPETKAFADGLTETLTAKLSQLGSNHPVEVVPAGEIRAMRIASPEQALKNLGVNLAVTGSLQRSNSTIRVTHVLIDTASGRQLAGDAIDASAADPFFVQDRVVSSVVAMMDIHPQKHESAALTAHGTVHPVAYDYYLRGRGYLQEYQRLTSIDSAVAVFQKALALDPKFPLAYAGLGEAYWRKYELTKDPALVDSALQNCEKASAPKPEIAEAYVCSGTVYAGTGKYDQAVKEFQSAIRLDPSDDIAFGGLATAYKALGRTGEAERTFKHAIALRPQYWSGYSRLGAFYFQQARYTEAAEMFAQVIALAPDNSRGYSNLGAVYLAQGRYADGIPLLERATSLQPAADAYSNLGTAYFQMRRFSDANRAYRKAVAIDGRTYTGWGNLADSEFLTPGGRSEAAAACKKAIDLAKVALRLNPRDSNVMANLADYYSMLNDKANAIRYLQAGIAMAPQDPELQSRAADVYNQLGDRNAAVEWLTKAIATGYSAAMIRDSPALDDLRNDPRVVSMLQGK